LWQGYHSTHLNDYVHTIDPEERFLGRWCTLVRFY
jgi:hypothetical protein